MKRAMRVYGGAGMRINARKGASLRSNAYQGLGQVSKSTNFYRKEGYGSRSNISKEEADRRANPMR